MLRASDVDFQAIWPIRSTCHQPRRPQVASDCLQYEINVANETWPQIENPAKASELRQLAVIASRLTPLPDAPPQKICTMYAHACSFADARQARSRQESGTHLRWCWQSAIEAGRTECNTECGGNSWRRTCSRALVRGALSQWLQPRTCTARTVFLVGSHATWVVLPRLVVRAG